MNDSLPFLVSRSHSLDGVNLVMTISNQLLYTRTSDVGSPSSWFSLLHLITLQSPWLLLRHLSPLPPVSSNIDEMGNDFSGALLDAWGSARRGLDGDLRSSLLDFRTSPLKLFWSIKEEFTQGWFALNSSVMSSPAYWSRIVRPAKTTGNCSRSIRRQLPQGQTRNTDTT